MYMSVACQILKPYKYFFLLLLHSFFFHRMHCHYLHCRSFPAFFSFKFSHFEWVFPLAHSFSPSYSVAFTWAANLNFPKKIVHCNLNVMSKMDENRWWVLNLFGCIAEMFMYINIYTFNEFYFTIFKSLAAYLF